MKFKIKDFLKWLIIAVGLFSSQPLLAKGKVKFITTDVQIREYHSEITLRILQKYLIPIMFNSNLLSDEKIDILHSFIRADNYQLFKTFSNWIKEVPGYTVKFNQRTFNLLIAGNALDFLGGDNTKKLSPSMLVLKNKPNLARTNNKSFKLYDYIENITNLSEDDNIDTIKTLVRDMNSLFLNTDLYSDIASYNAIWSALFKYSQSLPLEGEGQLNLRIRFMREILGFLYTPELSNPLVTQLYYLRANHDNFLSLFNLKTLYSEIMTILYTAEEPASDSKAS